MRLPMILFLVMAGGAIAGNLSIIEDNSPQGTGADLLAGSATILTANVTTTTGTVRTKSSLSIAMHYRISPVLSSGKTVRIIPIYNEASNPLNSTAVPLKDDESQTIAATDCQECILNFVPPMGVYSAKFQVVATENATITIRAGSK